MNCYVYGYGKPGKERLIVVDLGVTFPDMDGAPGVDVIMADIGWLIERADRIEAIFITHAHEDHIGALAHLWPHAEGAGLRPQVHRHLGALKLEEAGLDTAILHVTGAWPETVTAGPFKVGFLPISHSIPESAGLVIDTPAGRVVHTGDFKLDRTPGVGEALDRGALGLASPRPGCGRWSAIRPMSCQPRPAAPRPRSPATLEALIASAPGMMAATTFASNVARLKTLAEAATRAGRDGGAARPRDAADGRGRRSKPAS